MINSLFSNLTIPNFLLTTGGIYAIFPCMETFEVYLWTPRDERMAQFCTLRHSFGYAFKHLLGYDTNFFTYLPSEQVFKNITSHNDYQLVRAV